MENLTDATWTNEKERFVGLQNNANNSPKTTNIFYTKHQQYKLISILFSAYSIIN